MKKIFHMKAGKIFSFLAIILLSSFSLFSQTYLIPVDVPGNKYPITFTDANQQRLVLNFTKNVTVGANISQVGWSVTGTAATISQIDAAGTNVIITLSTSITFAERSNVKVTYNAAAGSFSMSDLTEPSFANIAAVNNYIAVAADFTNGLYGEVPPVDICAAVINVEVSSNISVSQRYRNSINFLTPRAYITWQYPLDVPKSQPSYIETGGLGTGLYSITQLYAGYPDNTLNCTWVVGIFPYLFQGGAIQPTLFVTPNLVKITLPNYKKDNGTPVPGTGDLALNPPIDDPSTLFCVGENIVAFTFTDATVFDCQLPVAPDLPNTRPRNAQFVYGTHAGAGIPNVFLNVFGTMVQVTDNNGVGIQGTWHVNPDGTANAGGYTTLSGYFEGPVVQYLWDNFTKVRVTPLIQTYPISHTGDFVNDMENDIFDVTLRNWGPCNPYDAMDLFTHLQAVTDLSRLRLVGAPPLPTASNLNVCFGASTQLSAVRNGTNPGTLHWYNNVDLLLTHEVGTGATYNPGALAAGVYNYWVREIGTTGQFCEGPAKQVVLTINPIPNKPSITITGSAPFCFNGVTSVPLTANPNSPPVVSTYQWFKDAVALNTNNANTFDQILQSGSYTLQTFGIAPTNCPSPLSDPVIVTIGNPATAAAGADQIVCSSSPVVTLAGSRGGGATSSTWTSSGTGVFADASLVNTTYTPSAADITAGTVNLTLTTNDPVGPCTAASDFMVVTINPAATVSANIDQTVCASSPVVTLAGSRGGGATTSTWTTSGSGAFSNAAIVNPTYTPSAADITAGTVTLTITTNDPVGPCGAVNDAMVVTINPIATVGAGADQTVCSSSPVVPLAGSRGGGATSSTWTSSGTGVFADASLVNTTYTPSAADITAGIVNLTLTTNDPAGPCTFVTDFMVVTINPAATVSANIDQTVCASSPVVTLAGSRGGGATTSTWTTSGSGAFSNAAIVNPTYTPSAADITAGTVTLTITTNDPAGPCAAVNDAMLVTINPIATVGAGADQTVCSSSPVVPLAGSRGGGATSSTWTSSGTGVFADASLVNTTYTPSAADITAGTVNLTLTTNDPAGACIAVTDFMVVTISPAATVNAGADQTICAIGTVTLAATRGGSATASTWTTSGTGTFANASLLNTVYTPSAVDILAQTVTLTISTNDPAGPCTSAIDNLVVLIGTKPSSATLTVSPDICHLASASTLKSVITSGTPPYTLIITGYGTFNNYNSGDDIGLGTLAVGDYTYTITSVTDNCSNLMVGGYPASKTISIKPIPSLTSTTPASQTICNNASGSIILNSTVNNTIFDYTFVAAPAVGYAWTVGKNPVVGSITDGDGNGTETLARQLEHDFTSSVSVDYTITPKGPGATACPGAAITRTVIVNPTAVITSAAAKTICDNASTAYTATSSTAGASFAWTRAVVAGIANLIGSGATSAINENLDNTSTAPVNVTYVITPSIGGCAGTPFNLLVSVNPTAVITSAAAQTVCDNSLLGYTATSSTAGVTFAWTRAVVAGIANPIGSGATSAINESLDNNTTAPINVTYVITPSFGVCPGTPFNLVVTVNPTPVINSAATKTICNNASTAYTATSSTAGATFVWTRAVVVGIINPIGSGATLAINENLDNTTSAPVNVTYVITPSIGACPGTAFNLVVTVNHTPVITSAAAQTVCDNSPLGYTATSSTGGVTFAWTRAVVIGIANAIGSGATSSINESLDNTTAAPINVTYVITPTLGVCPGTPFNLVVTVNPTPVITSAATKTICDNASTAYTATSSTAGATFAWTRALVLGIANPIGSGATSAINENLDNTSSAPVNVTYVITPSIGVCPGTPFNLVVTVNPTAVIISAAAKTVCNATPLGYTAASSTAGVTFAWTRAVVVGISNAIGSGAIASINESLNNTTTAPVNVTYVITPTIGVCAGTPFNLVVTVNPSAQVNQPANQILCNNTGTSAVAFGTTNTGGATTYSWTNSNATIGLGASGTGDIASFTAVNAGTAPVIATIVVTPLYTNGVGCTGSTKTFTITVNPTPILSTTLTPPTICSNVLFSYAPASATGGTTFSWSRASIAGITPIGPTSGANNPSETLRNLSSGTIAVTYQYTLLANTCSNTQNVVVNIKPEPVISVQSASVCSGNALNHKILLDNFTNPGDGVLFTWPLPINDPLLTGGTARVGASSLNMTDAFVNASGLALSSTYTITPVYNGCAGVNKNIIVTIGSEPVLDPGLNRAACSGIETLLELKQAPLSVIPTGYNITAITVSGGLAANGANTAVPANNVAFDYLKNHKFINQTGVNKTVTYRVVPLFGVTCIGAPVDVIVTIRPEPVILPGQVKTVCSNVAVNKEIVLVPANTPAGTLYSWNAPVMSNGSIQGSAGLNVTADPLLKKHITDILVNTSLVPITATYSIVPTSSFGCLGTSRDVVITVNPEPAIPVVSGRDKLCRGETNIVYSVPPVGGSSFTWTVPVAIGTKTFDFSTNAIIINAALVGGSGSISVFETNSLTCAGPPALYPVQVYDPPTVSVITGDNDVCSNSSSIYSVPAHAGSVYAWILPAGAALIGDPTANSVTVSFSTFSGNISVKETNAAGCVTNHTPLLVTVTALPTATISNGGTICQEGTRPLNIAFTGNGPWTFVHAINGIDQASIAAPVSPHTLTVNTQGTYTITSLTDSKSCVNTGTGNATVSYFPKPTAAISGTTAICKGNSTTITISLTGTAPYNFTYTDGVTPVNVVAFPAGTYTFTVSPLATKTYILTALTDNNSCTGLLSGSAVITVNIPPALTLTGTNLLCNGDNTGAIALVPVGTIPLTFAWTGPDGYVSGSEDITGLKAGIYNLTVTDPNTCSTTATLTITQPTVLQLANSGNISLLCNGATTGVGSFTASGGTSPYTFSTISNNTGGTINVPLASSVSFTSAGAGAIVVKVRDANGCEVQSTITITQPTALSLSSVISTSIEGSHNINCNGANTGTIGLSVTGGVSPYVYAWSTVGGSGIVAGASNQNALTAGAYTALITDANACTVTGNYTLTQPVALAVTATTTDAIIGTCSSATLGGTITGGVQLGGGGYIYSWSPAAGLSAANILNPVATPSSTTNYILTVTDANGCSKTSSILITVKAVLTAVAVTDDNNIGTCSHANLNVNVSGGEDFGAGVYTYSWAPVLGLSATNIKTPVAQPALTTTYTVTVTDANGCIATSNITINVAVILSATASTDDALIGTCPISDAQLSLAVLGGETPYTYLWNNAATLTNATISSPVAKPAATTTYTATITDGNGCTTTAPVLVTVAPALTAVASASDLIISTCPTSVSTLNVNVVGGEAAYTYKWLPSTGLDDSFIKNPVAKPALTTLYTVTVTDANGCTTTSSVTITVQPVLGVSSTADDYTLSSCGPSVANITSVVTGGEAGYTYSWAPVAGLSAINIPNPVAKPAVTTTYTLTVVDANGCSASGNITIIVQPALSVTLSASDPIISTCGGSTSTLNAVVSGGEPVYTYSWLPIAGLDNAAIQNPVAKPLATTTYTLTATDVNNCTVIGSITITVQPILAATATTSDNIIGACPSSLANLDVTVTGGEANYTYSWAPVLGLSNPFIKTPVAKPSATSTYTVTVTDANGCTTTSPVLVTVNPILSVVASTSDSNIGTCPSSKANLSAVAAGGEGPYTYSWLPVSGLTNPLIINPVAKPAVTTTYTVTVTDANGCTASSNVTVIVQPDLAATAIASDYNIGTCPTSTTTLDVNVIGGETAYTYLWNNAASLVSAASLKNPVAKPLVTTTFTVQIIDNNGCQTTAPVTVTVLPALTATASASDLIIGTCPTSTSNLDVTVGGGEAGYTYLWAPALGLSDATLKNPIAKPAVTTTYTVTVTDVNGCTTNSPITVTVAPVLTVVASASDLLISTCATSKSNLLATPAGGEMPVGGYLYSWSPSTGLDFTNIANPVAKPTSTTTYTVTITDQNNCTAVSSVTVNVAPALSAVANASDPLIGTCPTSKSTLDVIASGGEPGYTYSWIPAASLNNPIIKTPLAKPAITTTYTVTVTDLNGCQTTANVTVTVADPLAVTASASDALISTCPTSVSQLNSTVSGGEAAYIYSWNNAATLSNATIANPVAKPGVTTTYTVTITDANNCQSTASVTVNVAPVLNALASASDLIISTCATSVSTLDVTTTGGEEFPSGGYTYSWAPVLGLNYTNVKNPIAKPAATTTYTVTVTDFNGCTIQSSVTITVQPPLALSFTTLKYAGGYDISCFGNSNGQIDMTVSGGEAPFTYSWTGPSTYTSVAEDNIGLIAGTYNVTVTDINGCSVTGSVILIQPAVLSQSKSANVVLPCFGDNSATGSFSVSGGTGPFNFVVIANTSLATIVSSSATSQSFSLGAAGIVALKVTDANGCSDQDTIVITQPALLLPGSINGAQQVCYLGDPLTLNEVTPPTNGPGFYLYQWESSNAIAGVYADIPGANLSSYNPPSGIAATTFYRRRVNSGSCLPVYSNIVSVTVNPLPVAVISGDATICPASNTPLKVNISVGTSPYTVAINNGVANQVGYISNANINVNPSVYTEYSLVSVTDAKGCVSTAPTANLTGIAKIIIQPDILVTLQPVNAIVCEGITTSFTTTATGVGVTYKWQLETAGVFGNITDNPTYNNSSTSTLTINTPISALNGTKYRAVITDVCSRKVNTAQVILTINERPEVTVNPVAVTVCETANAIFTVNAGLTTSPTYQWQEFNGTTWSPIMNGGNYLGATSSLLNVFNVNSGMTSHQFRAVISGTCTPTATSLPATLTVNTAPKVTVNPRDTTVCENLPAHFKVTATGTALDYQWQVDMNDGSNFRDLADTATLYSGTTSATLNVLKPARRFNNYKYRVVVSGTCNPASPSAFAVLSVNTGPEISVQPVSQIKCEGTSVTFTVSVVGAGISYWWEENSGGLFVVLEDTSSYIGSKTNSLSIFNIGRAMSTNRYRVWTQGLCGIPVVSSEAVLTVKTSPLVTTSPADVTICENGTTTLSAVAEGSDLTYQWQVSPAGIFSNVSNDTTYTGANTANLTISDAETIYNGYKYKVIVSGSCAPPDPSDVATLLVNSNPVILLHPQPAIICENGFVSFMANAIGPNLSYQWQVSGNNGGTWNDIADDANYSGTTTTTLTVQNGPVSFNNNLYRVNVSSACTAISSNSAKLTVDANPLVNITGTGLFPLVCGGTPLTLNGNPTGGSGTYTSHSWTGDISPLNSFNTAQTEFKTIINGTYSLTYTVTDNKTCKTSQSVTITNDMPNAQFSSNALPSCGFLIVDFTNASTRATNYEWNFDDGSPIVTAVDTSHGFENIDPSGLVKYYKVELTAFSANGCKATTNQYITIYPKVDPTFTITPKSACQPIIATMITQPGAASYEWDFGDGQQVAGGYTILHQFNNPTNAIVKYGVSLQTTSFYGCKAIITDTIEVFPLPTPNFTVAPIIQTYPDATVTITSLVIPGPWTFNYTFGDGNSSTLDSPVHTYDLAGTYKIVQTVSMGNCSDSISQTVIINPIPPIAAFTLPVSGCTPLEIQFENTSSWGTTYRWEFGDGSISTKKDPSYTYFDAGTFPIRLTVTGPGGSSTASGMLEVFATPILNFSYTPDSVYINDKPVKFFNLSGYATNYSWNFGDYDEDTNAEMMDNTSTDFEPVHVYHSKGWKDVTLIGWNPNCSDTLIRENAVLVRPAGKFVFPNVFRPDPSGPIDPKWDKNDPNTVNKIFFPGVVESVLEYHLYIYNRWGEQIFSTDDITIGWNGYINGELAKQGVYIWKVTGKYTNKKNFSEAGDVTLLY